MTHHVAQERAEIRHMTISHDALAATLWDLSLNLARAANLHKQEGHQRRGVLTALRAVTRYLHDLNFSGDQIEPLHHVLQALLDADEGRRIPKLFAPDEHKKKRNPSEGSAYWGLRGFLWAAMEIRCAMDGIGHKEAAERVARDRPEAYRGLRRGNDPETHSDGRGRLDDLTNKLIQLHKTISEKQKYPKEGNVVPAIVAATNELLIAAENSSTGHELLRCQYFLALAMAERHIDRLS